MQVFATDGETISDSVTPPSPPSVPGCGELNDQTFWTTFNGELGKAGILLTNSPGYVSFPQLCEEIKEFFQNPIVSIPQKAYPGGNFVCGPSIYYRTTPVIQVSWYSFPDCSTDPWINFANITAPFPMVDRQKSSITLNQPSVFNSRL